MTGAFRAKNHSADADGVREPCSFEHVVKHSSGAPANTPFREPTSLYLSITPISDQGRARLNTGMRFGTFGATPLPCHLRPWPSKSFQGVKPDRHLGISQ